MTINGISGQYANQVFPINDSMVFGRNLDSCNVLFADNTKGISRMHCKVENVGGNITITDLGSSYGTFVNGMKLQPYTPRVLKAGDTFYLGDKNNLFSLSGVATAAAAAAPVQATAPAQGPGFVNSPKNPSDDKSLLIAAIALGAVIIIGFIVYMIQRTSEPWYVRFMNELFIKFMDYRRFMVWR